MAEIISLEEQLKSDESGKIRDQLLQKFKEEAGKLSQLINAGVAPAEYERLNALLAAYNAAEVVVHTVWNQSRGNSI
ncbi:MAG: EscE/YscE/SsaE family type III secretion system needle protein co-chaperone [Thiotrichales bacterium]